MTLLLITATWMISVSLVAGLCRAARAGDRVSLSLADAGDQGASTLGWEQADGLQISARAGAARARTAEPGAGVLHSDGVAA